MSDDNKIIANECQSREVYMKCKMTVIKKASPTPMPANLIRVLSTGILLEYSGETYRSSEVTRSIIAVIANHTLMSNSVSGKFIIISLSCAIKPSKKCAYLLQLFFENSSNVINSTF